MVVSPIHTTEAIQRPQHLSSADSQAAIEEPEVQGSPLPHGNHGTPGSGSQHQSQPLQAVFDPEGSGQPLADRSAPPSEDGEAQVSDQTSATNRTATSWSHDQLWPHREHEQRQHEYKLSQQWMAALAVARAVVKPDELLKKMVWSSFCTGLGSPELASHLLGNPQGWMAESDEPTLQFAKELHNPTQTFRDFHLVPLGTETDGLVGGSPCQPFAGCGNRQGTSDPVLGQLIFTQCAAAAATTAYVFLIENSEHIASFKGPNARASDQSFLYMKNHLELSHEVYETAIRESATRETLVEVLLHYASVAGWAIVDHMVSDAQHYNSGQSRKRFWALFVRRGHRAEQILEGYKLPLSTPNSRPMTAMDVLSQKGVDFPSHGSRIEPHRIRILPQRRTPGYDQAIKVAIIDEKPSAIGHSVYHINGIMATIRKSDFSPAGGAGAYLTEEGCFRLDQTAAAAAQGFPPSLFKDVHRKFAIQLIGNSMHLNVITCLLASIQLRLSGPQVKLLDEDKEEEKDLTLLSSGADVGVDHEVDMAPQVGTSRPANDIQNQAFVIPNIQSITCTQPHHGVPKVPTELLGIHPREFLKPGVAKRIMQWHESNIAYILNLDTTKPGKNPRMRAPLPLIMYPEEYAAEQFVEWLLKGCVFDFRSGQVQQVDPDTKPRYDYNFHACFKDAMHTISDGGEPQWQDHELASILENGVPLGTSKPTPVVLLCPMQKNLAGYVGKADKQLKEDGAQGWQGVFYPSCDIPLPMAPYKGDPQGSVPKKLMGVLTGKARLTTNKSKEVNGFSTNSEVQSEKMARMKMTKFSFMALAAAILATTGERVFILCADLKSAFRQLPYAPTAVWSSGVCWADPGQAGFNSTRLPPEQVRPVTGLAYRMQFGGKIFPYVYGKLGDLFMFKVRREFKRREDQLCLPPNLQRWIDNRKRLFKDADVDGLHGGNWQVVLFWIAIFVDDIAGIIVGMRKMLRLKLCISDVLLEMGFPLAAEKWQLGQKALYLGLGIDLCRGIQFIPEGRRANLITDIKKWMCANQFTFKPFHSFLCHLNFVIHLVLAGRRIMRPAWRLCFSNTRATSGVIKMTPKVTGALQRILEALEQRAVMPIEPQFDWLEQLTSSDYPAWASDASMRGMGGVAGQVYWTYTFTPDQANFISMPGKEALATLANVAIGGHFIEHLNIHTAVKSPELLSEGGVAAPIKRSVLEQVDCTAVESAINKDDAKSVQLLEILDERQKYLDRYSLKTVAKYVMSKDHAEAEHRERTSGIVAIDIADALSRMHSDDSASWAAKAQRFMLEAKALKTINCTDFKQVSVPQDVVAFATDLATMGSELFPEGLLRD